MNDELKTAIEEVLGYSGQDVEFKRRLTRLIENIVTANHTDADVRQVIELAEVGEEDS